MANKIAIPTDISTEQLERLFGDSLVRKKISQAMRAQGEVLRELERWKLANGYCILGITCMRRAMKGPRGCMRGCEKHRDAREAGVKTTGFARFQSEYGRMVHREVELERERIAREEEPAPTKRKSNVVRMPRATNSPKSQPRMRHAAGG